MYTPFVDLSAETFAITRRTFLKSCSALGLCLAGCGTFFSNTRFAGLMVNRPHPDEYRPILRDLIQTILPFGHPKFPPVLPDTVESRLLDLFRVEEEERFLGFQKGLVFFDELALFPHAFAPITAEETNAFISGDESQRVLADSDIARKLAHDQRLNSDFLTRSASSAERFVELSLEQKRLYLGMWGQSGFLIKRQFYRSTKALVMITAYSMEEFWKAIGYEGTFLERH